MTAKTKTQIKAFFETSDTPTEAQFIDFIDSYVDKSGPVGTLETAASGAAVGLATFNGASPNVGSITAYDVVRDSMGIAVYTTAQVTNIVGATVVTTAQASAIASDVIAAGVATTAQANAGTASLGVMTPVLTKNAIQSLGAGALVLLKTLTASSSATIDFVNGSGGVVFDSTYKGYMVMIAGMVPATDGASLYMRTSTNAGSSYDSSASDYGYAIDKTGTVSQTAAAQIPLADSVGNTTGRSCSGTVHIFDPSDTSVRKIIKVDMAFYDNSGNELFHKGTAARRATADIDAIRFLMSSGNITSGTFKLYGVM